MNQGHGATHVPPYLLVYSVWHETEKDEEKSWVGLLIDVLLTLYSLRPIDFKFLELMSVSLCVRFVASGALPKEY